MEIALDNIGKRYRYDWIFRKVNYTFQSGASYALSGPNGSGKSTFLKVLSGHLSPTKGQVDFRQNGQQLDLDLLYREVNFAAPYIDLIEELSLNEAIRFHCRFKKLRQGLQTVDLVDRLGLKASLHKEIRFFSSGMKQRVKLALAICSEGTLLLLDEPTTNLDAAGAEWYRHLVKEFQQGRTLVVASNVESDFDFCEERLSILDYKVKGK
ncbi:MAG: ABC transporter ATP-binding protein [Bacteroidota bacterium]